MNPNEMTADEMPFISQLRSQIESILLVIDSPATSASIARAVESTSKKLKPYSKKSAPNWTCAALALSCAHVKKVGAISHAVTMPTPWSNSCWMAPKQGSPVQH